MGRSDWNSQGSERNRRSGLWVLHMFERSSETRLKPSQFHVRSLMHLFLFSDCLGRGWKKNSEFTGAIDS